MKTKITLFILLFSLSAPALLAQELHASWSNSVFYDNKQDGFFERFVGYNSQYIVAKFNRMHIGFGRRDNKIKLVAFDKNSMKKVGEVPIIGFPANEKNKKKYEGLSYFRTVVLENNTYVFWEKYENSKDQIYIQSYDNKLAPVNPLKKVYELSSNEAFKSAETFVLTNENNKDQIIIGGERAVKKKGDAVTVEYKVMNADFSFASSGQVELPIKMFSSYGGLSSNYKFGDDGNLYIKTMVTISKEEEKKAKKEDKKVDRRYSVFTIVNTKEGTSRSLSIKSDNKNIFNFSYLLDKDQVKIFGFFSDLQKDPKGQDTHGIFYATINSQSVQVENVNYSYFTKGQLDKLFSKDKEDRKDRHLFKSSKKAESEEESIASDYIIEDVQSIDKDNLVLFCSIMRNYSVRSCSSSGSCTTRYYCQKSNVTAFKINNSGEIVWATNLDRSITYSGWDVWDVSVINADKKFFVIYGSDFQMTSNKKNFTSKKSKSQMRDRMEYGVFDYATGDFEKKELKVNAVNVEKKDRKTISASEISIFENKFYANSMRIRYKPNAYIFGCLGAVVCLPTIWVPCSMGGFKRGIGFMGKLVPKD